LSMGRWISWLSSSMAIQVHQLKSHHDGSVWCDPAGGKIPSGNSPSFIDSGWYCWYWALCLFAWNDFFLQIRYWTYFRWVLPIFNKWSGNTYSDAYWCYVFWGTFRASAILG
jgi:hypothetical protein